MHSAWPRIGKLYLSPKKRGVHSQCSMQSSSPLGVGVREEMGTFRHSLFTMRAIMTIS